MRHGQTEGNALRRYIGRTDEPLSQIGALTASDGGIFLNIKRVYVSPMVRARQTAGICFPNAEQVVINDFREMNFGDFENRSANDMEHDPAYRAWVESGCLDRCPNGDIKAEFDKRVISAFEKLMEKNYGGRSIILAHGGTIMSIMGTFCSEDRPYYRWNVPNCGGYRIKLSRSPLSITSYEYFTRLKDLK